MIGSRVNIDLTKYPNNAPNNRMPPHMAKRFIIFRAQHFHYATVLNNILLRTCPVAPAKGTRKGAVCRERFNGGCMVPVEKNERGMGGASFRAPHIHSKFVEFVPKSFLAPFGASESSVWQMALQGFTSWARAARRVHQARRAPPEPERRVSPGRPGRCRRICRSSVSGTPCGSSRVRLFPPG